MTKNKEVKPTRDRMPLELSRHPNMWGFNTGIKILDRVLDYIELLVHRPKLTKSNLEKCSITKTERL